MNSDRIEMTEFFLNGMVFSNRSNAINFAFRFGVPSAVFVYTSNGISGRIRLPNGLAVRCPKPMI
jgi:hypothetical protein